MNQSSTTGPLGHTFIRPGQVAPDRPAPDRCMECGRPEADHRAADPRIQAAREFLAGARTRKVSELPPSLLVREVAELRRLLGQMRDIIGDYEADDMVTVDLRTAVPSGGAYLTPADVLVLGQALRDAIAYRGGDEGGAYVTLADGLGIGLTPGGAE
jgi:hypothetical protein